MALSPVSNHAGLFGGLNPNCRRPIRSRSPPTGVGTKPNASVGPAANGKMWIRVIVLVRGAGRSPLSPPAFRGRSGRMGRVARALREPA